MNILVCGGAGYIGSHMVRRLVRSGHAPVVFDNFSTGHEAAVERAFLGYPGGAQVLRGDLLDPAALDAAFASRRFDAVMHFAGLILVGESVTKPGLYYENNVTGTLNLLRAMEKANVSRFVFSSTCAIFGEPETMPVLENLPRLPINPYGNTKLVAEMMMADFARAHAFKCVALRYFNAAGADDAGDLGENHDPESHLIPNAIKAALGQAPALKVFGNDYDTPDGTCLRDYVHVNDLADAHLAALAFLEKTPDGTGSFDGFNLGTGRATSVLEIISSVEAVSGKKVPYSFAPRRPGDSPVLYAGPGKANSVLGWVPRYTEIDGIVESAWKWHSRG
ncbi:UDP-glucose 4-epimerase GalE [Desulfovibrio sp. OttesenSCG-928-O18]|nr:UDP-glucose 4-epimerase GalE [Desulfovibrio sp. OttesenSCG-928-O18]